MGLVAVVASSALVLGACGGGNAGGQQGGAAQSGGNAGAGENSACVAASQILDNTQSYAGKQVTVTGTVGQVVGPHAFTMAATGNTQGGAAQTLLAVEKETASLTPGSPVEVTGTLQPTFSTDQAQAFTGGTLDQAAFTAYNGTPYLQAVFAGPVSANLTRSQGGIFGIGSSGCGSANQVLNNMQSYTGQQITIAGSIGQVVGPHAFTVTASGNAQGATPQTVLAVTKETMLLTVGSPVQVTGMLQPAFNTNQVQAFTGGTLDQAAFTAYNGKPYIQAVFSGPVSANLSGGQGTG
jgi:energy-converting hydrogenase Eha subunit E